MLTINRTKELKRLVMDVLRELSVLHNFKMYYQQADACALYPHIVISFDNISTQGNRYDYSLFIDIWGKANKADIDTICDDIEKIFKNLNMPTQELLATFFTENRRNNLPDEDKTINHSQIIILTQTYERTST